MAGSDSAHKNLFEWQVLQFFDTFTDFSCDFPPQNQPGKVQLISKTDAETRKTLTTATPVFLLV